MWYHQAKYLDVYAEEGANVIRQTFGEVAVAKVAHSQKLMTLDHPNICTIYEINETGDGQLYVVMAHYEGETLKERIERARCSARSRRSTAITC